MCDNIGQYQLWQGLCSLLQVSVSLCFDALQALLVHQLGGSWDLWDEEIVRKPDDICSQGDGWDLQKAKKKIKWDFV